MGSKQFLGRLPKRSLAHAVSGARNGFAGMGLRVAIFGGRRGDGSLMAAQRRVQRVGLSWHCGALVLARTRQPISDQTVGLYAVKFAKIVVASARGLDAPRTAE
jgi:hypothetical protein